MNTTTMGTQRNHHLSRRISRSTPTAQSSSRSILTGMFVYLRFSIGHDSLAAVLHADLLCEARSAAAFNRGTSTSYFM